MSRAKTKTSPQDNDRKLRPCREIIQQLRWDPRYDLEAYDIHYEERFAGMRTISLASFLAKSEIPWHRIRQISVRSLEQPETTQLVWDRDQRIDLLSNAPPPTNSQTEDDPTGASYLPKIEAESTYHSALVLIPPASLWAQIQEIRCVHDSSFQRWMPHINILYGFVPEEHLPQAAELIELLIEAHQLQPFTITFREIGAFSHRRSTTLWLQPDIDVDDSAHNDGKEAPNIGPIHQLQQAFLPHFPKCDEQARKSADGFTPHLTIAKIPHGKQLSAEQLQKTLQRSWQPISFPVEHIHLIHRQGEQPFQIAHSIPLSSQTTYHSIHSYQPEATAPERPFDIQSPKETEAGEPPAQLDGQALVVYQSIQTAWAALQDSSGWHLLCEGETDEALQRHTLLWYGSHAIGIAGPESDLDLLAIAPEDIPPRAVFEALLKQLSPNHPTLRWRIVEDAMLPALKLSLDGLDVEVTCAHLPLGLWGHDMQTWRPALATLPDADKRALQGVIDASILRSLLKEHGAEDRFRALAMALKDWSHARGLDSGAAGYIGGFGWSIIAAWWCLHAAPTPPDTPHLDRQTEGSESTTASCTDLAALFGQLAAWDGDQPIYATATPPAAWQRHPKRDRLPIMTLCAPFYNIARTITTSTAHVLKDEWDRVHALLSLDEKSDAQDTAQTNWRAATAPSEPAVHPVCVRLNIEPESPSTNTPAALDACEGWLKGLFLSFVLHMEDRLSALPWVSLRPYPGGKETPWMLCIGQPGQQLEPRQLRRLKAETKATNDWLRERWERWKDRPEGYDVAVTFEALDID